MAGPGIGGRTTRADQERLLLDAVAELLGSADVRGALALWPAVAQFGPSARRSALLGHLNLCCGRGVVARSTCSGVAGPQPRHRANGGVAAATSLFAYLSPLDTRGGHHLG